MTEKSKAEQRAEIIAKVRKLAAIANPDSNAFQGEMENAAKLISKLMDDYTISWGEVHEQAAREQEAELKDEFIAMQAENQIRGIMQWHWELAGLIARVTHTKTYGHTDKKMKNGVMVFFGAETNAAVATALFAEWSLIIERMAVNAYSSRFKQLRKVYGAGDGLMDRVPPSERLTNFKPSFIQGVVDGMREVVNCNERERSRESTMALMVISSALNKRYAELSTGFRSAKVRKPEYHEAGYKMGRKVGENIDISLKRVASKRDEPKSEQPKQLGKGD